MVVVAQSMTSAMLAAYFLPTYSIIYDNAKENGYSGGLSTYCCVSALCQICYSIGGFVGPTIGGHIVGISNFNTLILLVSFIVAVSATLLSVHSVYCFFEKKWKCIKGAHVKIGLSNAKMQLKK